MLPATYDIIFDYCRHAAAAMIASRRHIRMLRASALIMILLMPAMLAPPLDFTRHCRLRVPLMPYAATHVSTLTATLRHADIIARFLLLLR